MPTPSDPSHAHHFVFRNLRVTLHMCDFRQPATPGQPPPNRATMKRQRHMKPSETRVLRMIALFKLLKATALIVVGLGALRLVHADIATLLAHLVKRFGLDPRPPLVVPLLHKA